MWPMALRSLPSASDSSPKDSTHRRNPAAALPCISDPKADCIFANASARSHAISTQRRSAMPVSRCLSAPAAHRSFDNVCSRSCTHSSQVFHPKRRLRLQIDAAARCNAAWADDLS